MIWTIIFKGAYGFFEHNFHHLDELFKHFAVSPQKAFFAWLDMLGLVLALWAIVTHLHKVIV